MPTEARQALRVVVAALAAVALTRAFSLPQGYWAVITAVIVIQASVGASVKTAIDRFAGSFVGAAAGVAVAAAVPLDHLWGLAVAVLVAVGPTAWFAATRPRFRLAPITAVIIILTATGERETTMTLAFQRVVEIFIGNLVGVATAIFVLPARAHTLVASTASRVVTCAAELLDLVLGDGAPDAQRTDLLFAQMRATVTALESASDEAALERKSRLTDESDTEPLVRSVRRFRNDVTMIGRAAATAAPLPHLAPQRHALREQASTYFVALATSLRDHAAPPATEPIVTSLRAYALEVERLRATDALRVLTGPQMARLYAMGFSLEQLGDDLKQLRDRIAELDVRSSLAG